MTETIAIVGGGFCGTLTAVHLLRGARKPLRVVLIERAPPPGRGVAYGTDDPCHLLNVPAAKMSAFPGQDGHFLEWLAAEGAQHGLTPAARQAGSFVPRLVYSAYLRSLLKRARDQAPAGVFFETVEGEVTGLRPEAGGARLELKGGRSLEAGRVVLALGNFAPPAIPLREGSLPGSPRYLENPWAPGALSRLCSSDALLLIGSGLTTVNLVLSLEKAGYRGRIHAVSRHGLLPQAHKAVKPRPLSLNLQELSTGVRPLMRLLREEARAAAAEGLDWRAAVDSLRPFTQEVWRSWPARERGRFLRHVRPYWDAHRHRIPAEAAEVLEKLLFSARLVLHPGRLTGVRAVRDGLEVNLRRRVDGGSETLRTAYAVNCTGPQCDYRRLEHPLVKDLLTQGLIRPDPMGLGLETADDGALLDGAGSPSAILFTLGPPRKAMLWETIAVPELKVQAAALADKLLR